MGRPGHQALVLSKTARAGYRQAGKGGKTIWVGHTTLITTRGRPPGSGLMLTTVSVNRGAKWRQIGKWSDKLTRTVCCQKTAQAPVLQVSRRTGACAVFWQHTVLVSLSLHLPICLHLAPLFTLTVVSIRPLPGGRPRVVI